MHDPFIPFLTSPVEIRTANIGNYPRVGQGENEQRVRRAIARWEKDELTDEELKEVQFSKIREIIREQEEAGLDEVTDGQIRWYCPFSHIVRKLDGVEINGLLRYFDTNFYFRQPDVRSRPERTGTIVGEEFEVAREAAEQPVRQILTGPYTLAQFSILEEGNNSLSREDLIEAYASLLREEIRDLREKGVKTVQFDEHGIRDREEDIGLLAEGLEEATRDIEDVQISASFSFGSPETVLGHLDSLPVDECVLDCVYDDRVETHFETHSFPDYPLVFGVINARNTKLEDPEETADWMGNLLDGYPHDRVGLSPSTGLEFLPRYRARDKMNLLTDIRKLLSNQS